MKGRWLQSLFGRMFAVQLISLVAVFLVFGGLVLRDQSRANARLVAPIWATAVQARLAQPVGSNAPASSSEVVATEVLVTLGTPPADARYPKLIARYRALIQELGHADLEVRQVALSHQDTVTTTWLEVASSPGQYRWVGITEDVEAASLWGPTGFGLLLALGMVAASAWWMSRILIRPLSELKTAMQTYTQTGTIPALQVNQGPVETRDMAAQFVDLMRQREQNDRTREVMLAGISHDLRSPLGRIRMGAELLPDDADNLAWKKVIVDNVVLADRLLESFMDYARSQQLTPDSAVDLRELVTQQCSLRDIPLVCDTNLPAQLVVKPANALGLERALNNLLDNAQKYGAPPVEVTLMVQNARLCIIVSDHGAGLDPSQIKLLLQPFHRGETSRNTPGTGLGLAIVNETVRRHGGQLRLFTTATGFSVEMALPSNLG